MDPSHIVRLGKEDNFWEHGSGPCGPCSEIYFDRGEKYGCGSPTCGVGCDCDRFVEVWNLVFTQFENDGNGNYTPLDHPNIDTGMGLERLACVMQGVDNLFLVDTIQNIMKKVSEISGVAYGSGEKTDISLRVITDHIRSTTFMISDGIMPSNAGRGYVLRRLLRRAARHGRLLGIQRLFLAELCDTVIQENRSAYPQLVEKQEFIKKVIAVEEESFARTIDQGMALLNQMVESVPAGGVLSGEDAFKLNDTYGFPIDLTKEILAEKGMQVDEETFHALMKRQKDTARAARKKSDGESWASDSTALEHVEATRFEGYETLESKAKVLAVVSGGEQTDAASEGDEIILVLDRTPFYGEGGGQVGDTGVMDSARAHLRVTDTTKNASGIFFHHCVVENGEITVGDEVTAQVERERREAIMRNHTAAHLLQAALRKVLGTHVEQAGQLVNDRHVRFDFTHFSALTAEELAQVERLVNGEILKGVPVIVREMPIEEAKKQGAMALFGEKYGDVVRVVRAGDFSVELCGGTHADNTAKLGLFKITAESSVAAGVRRIEGVTGFGVYELLNQTLSRMNEAAESLKANGADDVVRRAVQVMSELKAKEKENEALSAKLAAGQVRDLLEKAKEVGGVKLVTAVLPGTASDALRTLCDTLRSNSEDAVAVLATVNGEKAAIAAAVGKQAQKKGAHAGNLVREVAKLAGGNGGGRPDSAMAGAKDPGKLESALGQAEAILAGMLKA